MTTTDFNEAISKNSDYLRPYAQKLTKDIDDAKDLFQETMMRALMNREKYRVGTNIKAWLYTIMRNIFINNYRKNKRFSKIETDTPQDIIMHHTNQQASNSGYANIRMGEIHAEMQKLPDSYRQSFELYHMGYKYQDISEVLNEPLGTVKSRIHFARKILTSKLDR